MVKQTTQEIGFMELNVNTQFWIILGAILGIICFFWLLSTQSQISSLPHKVCENVTYEMNQSAFCNYIFNGEREINICMNTYFYEQIKVYSPDLIKSTKYACRIE